MRILVGSILWMVMIKPVLKTQGTLTPTQPPMQAQPSENPPAPPLPSSREDCARGMEELRQTVGKQTDAPWRERLLAWMDAAEGQALLAAMMGNSPYLTRLLLRKPSTLADFVLLGPNEARDRIFFNLREHLAGFDDIRLAMPSLRQTKAEVALLTALADISGAWDLTTTTEMLSYFAEVSIRSTLACLLKQAQAKGEIERAVPAESGIFVLGMGKLGSLELNYSSDIDLIIFYEPERLSYIGKHTPQHFMTRLVQEMIRILQERTADGYVFRTDLRLRPDPRSTPLAVTVGAAITYYESVGQNWERAALIKARVVAGDENAGRAFLSAIRPFIWRRHLDFAAINDILSIKRQMHSKGREEIMLPGHNIKTGRGGIREIEFLAQIYQLIWGGRLLQLRIKGTLRTLNVLAEAELLRGTVRDALAEAYVFLRTVEHRLQMIDDQQTHTLPDSPEGMRRLALFMGFSDSESFALKLLGLLEMVHRHYNAAFSNSTPLGEEKGRLVFTGVDDDDATLTTLTQMGYTDASHIAGVIRDWHKGYRRATRTKRSRELLTELMPHLLKALSSTANPDAAFKRFDEFIESLPAGVQIFSLFSMNQHLLGLVADIMGSAPQLGATLSSSPHLLYAVLTTDFFGPLPARRALETELGALLVQASDTQEALAMLHTFKSEKQFQAGLQLLRRAITPEETGQFLSLLADVVIGSITAMTERDFIQAHGRIAGGQFGILSIGKLGGCELTFGSDIDLIFVYDAEEEAVSDGAKPLGAMVYYTRLTQRVIGMLTAQGREGRLYDVDTRMRPHGNKGPLAASLGGFDKYFAESAWVFEKLALTRGRVVLADAAFAARIRQTLRTHLTAATAPSALLEGLRFIREKIAEHLSSQSPWDIKHAEGGLLDCDFLLQYLTLRHGHAIADALPATPSHVLAALRTHALVEASVLDTLAQARQMLSGMLFYLRLCAGEAPDIAHAPAGLQRILTQVGGCETMEELEKKLARTQHDVSALMQQVERL